MALGAATSRLSDAADVLHYLLTSGAGLRVAKSIPSRVAGRISRAAASEADFRVHPPVIANSVPKSGTNLIIQIVQAFPGARDFGTVLSSAPARPNIERPFAVQLQMIDKIAPREVVRGHLFYRPEFAAALERHHFVHYFNYRDPRDVCISTVHYLKSMTHYHSLHRVFALECANDEERLALAIKGLPEPRPDADYPDIGAQFARYRGWMAEPSVFCTRFEDLRGDSARKVVRDMLVFYRERTNREFDLEASVAKAMLAIDPSGSHTFRSGETAQWKRVFTPKHRRLFKDVAGELLIELGYEKDMDW